MQTPCDLAQMFEPGFQGTIRLVRGFNRPTGLNAAERVWLVLEDAFEAGKIVLNGLLVGQSAPLSGSTKLEITDCLLPHNLLTIELIVERGRIGRFNGARIEITARSEE